MEYWTPDSISRSWNLKMWRPLISLPHFVRINHRSQQKILPATASPYCSREGAPLVDGRMQSSSKRSPQGLLNMETNFTGIRQGSPESHRGKKETNYHGSQEKPPDREGCWSRKRRISIQLLELQYREAAQGLPLLYSTKMASSRQHPKRKPQSSWTTTAQRKKNPLLTTSQKI